MEVIKDYSLKYLVKQIKDRKIKEAIWMDNCVNITNNVDPMKTLDTVGGKRIISTENAGGTSELSEAYSYELLCKQFNAQLLKTEMEVEYNVVNSKKIDYTCNINDIKIGVSVTRAYKPFGEFDENDALELMVKKLKSLIKCYDTMSVDEWDINLLHIWCQNSSHVNQLHNIYIYLKYYKPELLRNTIVYVTCTNNGEWGWLYRQDLYYPSENYRTGEFKRKRRCNWKRNRKRRSQRKRRNNRNSWMQLKMKRDWHYIYRNVDSCVIL